MINPVRTCYSVSRPASSLLRQAGTVLLLFSLASLGGCAYVSRNPFVTQGETVDFVGAFKCQEGADAHKLSADDKPITFTLTRIQGVGVGPDPDGVIYNFALMRQSDSKPGEIADIWQSRVLYARLAADQLIAQLTIDMSERNRVRGAAADPYTDGPRIIYGYHFVKWLPPDKLQILIPDFGGAKRKEIMALMEKYEILLPGQKKLESHVALKDEPQKAMRFFRAHTDQHLSVFMSCQLVRRG